jgi:hypothetical protein
MADGKTYGGIKKIFELSCLHSSGIMINGNADFQNVPIETLINEFKFEQISDKFLQLKRLKTSSFASCLKILKCLLVMNTLKMH